MILALGIWLHARTDSQPPLYDAFSYYTKAYNTWNAIKAGNWAGIFQADPTFRPPGTVLMSYPFGFNPDPAGFLFRAVFFAALLLGAAVLIASYRLGLSWNQRCRSILIAGFFSTLPMLYAFDINPLIPAPAYWGLVDPFFTGCAAFTMACAWRSIWRGAYAGRWAWYALTGLFGAFCIIVKPSGVAVAACAGIAWGCFALLNIWRMRGSRAGFTRAIVNLLGGGVIIAAPMLVILLVSLETSYLSASNLAFGQAAMGIMKTELILPYDLLFSLIHYNFGDAFLAWFILVILMIISAGFIPAARRGGAGIAPVYAAALCAVPLAIFGAWFWIVASGGVNQMRYGMPFFMMAAVMLVPALCSAWEALPRWMAAPLVLIMLAAPVNLALLLLLPDPSIAWQKFAGVDVTPPPPTGMTAEFNALVSLPRTKPESVYSITLSLADAVGQSIFLRQHLMQPDSDGLVIRRPIDWARPSTYRIADIAAAAYILVIPFKPGWSPPANIGTLDMEENAMLIWANNLTPNDGTQLIYNSSDMILYRITDPAKLTASLLALVSRHTWRPVFTAANAALLAQKGS